MKTINFFKGLLALAISLTLVQCTSDDPIPGPAGANGTNGINGAPGAPGTPGIDGGNVCLSCHNVDFKVVQPATYAISGHAIGGNNLGKSGACNACHNEEGYLASKANNWEIASSTIIPTPATKTPIGCTTCHSGGHAAAALAISGKDAALRSADAYKLNQKTAAGADIIIDYKNNSNSCIHCHQSRRNDVTGLAPNATTGLISLSTHSGPHYGNQVALLEGMFGAELVGPNAPAYPAKGTAIHRTGSSCTQCHMGAAKDGKGNHTMSPKIDVCKTCHTGAGVVNYNINGGQTKIKNLMLELAEELVRVSPETYVIYNYTGSKSFPAANTPTDHVAYHDNDLSLLNQSGATAHKDNDKAVRSAKAFWNWRYIYQDHSYGLHNPKYAEALLKNTIANLKLLP
ncbi:MAG: ammonia-forming cytochrome c nitrite reductase subunit c552 [Flavobacteriaceae bacterium]|nr:ammonia-forming cytochrome c nitrite reductase subunit c552 [Flavobacteriaceae bacterium]